MTSDAREEKSMRPDWADRSRTTRLVWRVGVGVVGAAVLIGGIFLIPYPGPGWLVVFASPFHKDIPMSQTEREIFADYSAINMPMRVEDVPPEMRF